MLFRCVVTKNVFINLARLKQIRQVLFEKRVKLYEIAERTEIFLKMKIIKKSTFDGKQKIKH